MGIFNSLKYNLLLFYYVLVDKATPFRNKFVIIASVAYFISPVDFIPELVPFLGITDDAAAIAACISAVSSSVTPLIKEKAQKKIEG